MVANNFKEFPFDCEPPDLAFKCRCQNHEFLGTVINCVETYSEDSQALAAAYTYLLDSCSAQTHMEYRMVHLARAYDNATSYLINSTEIDHSKPLYNPVIINETAYDQSYESVRTLMKQRMDSTYMGWGLFGYWILVLAVATIINTLQWCCPYTFERLDRTRPVSWIKRHLICPQLIKPPKVSEKSSLAESIYRMPVRIDVLVLFVYLILIVVFCCVDYTLVTPNTVFKCSKGQLNVDIADRTGIIGTMQLPLVFLFAMRNNPLTKITGISYRTFQTFHRWLSRITFVLILLHGAFYLSYVHARHDYIARWGLLKWRMANTGFVALTVTTLWGSFRRRFYEWFKYTHKVFLVVFVVGAWYHCLTLGWIEFIAVSFGIWGADYICRLAKVVATGGVLKAHCSVLFELKVVKKRLVRTPQSIRMEVNHSGWWKPFPGAYCWICFVKWNMFWQAHPFTVVSAKEEQNFNQLVFIVKVKDGLTKQLAKYVASQPNAECTMHVLIEGPYGANIPFKGFSHAMYVAGGVGMTVVYSIATDLAQIFRAQVLRGQDPNKSISLIWMVPNFEMVVLFKKEIQKLKEFSDMVTLRVYVTRPLLDSELQLAVNKCNEGQELDEQFEETSIDTVPKQQHDEMVQFLEWLMINQQESSAISIQFSHRPQMETEMAELYEWGGSTAVVACGPPMLNADVRKVTVDCLSRGQSVQYFEEELLW